MSKNAKAITGKVDAKVWVKDNKCYPQVGLFSEEKALQKFYKQLDDEQLVEWCTAEGLTYIPCETSVPINRMRMAMAILYKHFPKKTTTTAKPKSKYAEMSTESLIQLAIDKCVPVEITEDMRIMRMRTIMALRAAKVID